MQSGRGDLALCPSFEKIASLSDRNTPTGRQVELGEVRTGGEDRSEEFGWEEKEGSISARRSEPAASEHTAALGGVATMAHWRYASRRRATSEGPGKR